MKTLVNIFDPQEPLAAYLFVKQYYAAGDNLLFISTREDRDAVSQYAASLHIDASLISVISFKRSEDSYIYERICRRLRSRLSPEADYWVNLAGGTRYSALAVERVFAAFRSRFFYMQTRENVVVSSVFDDNIDDNDDIIEPVRYRMTLAEYFELHGLRHDLAQAGHEPIRNAEQADRIFLCFKERRLPQQAFDAIERLRLHYRGCRRPVSIYGITHGSRGHAPRPRQGTASRRDAIPGLPALLNAFGFVPEQPDVLLPEEIDFLTGGWFEEYAYHLLKRIVSPQQIAIGVRISHDGSSHDNELDVVFIKANTLFVVECKTGIATDHMFNEIVYKACALKEAFLGMACHSYIFTLKNDRDGRLREVADMMGITLCAKAALSDPDQVSAIASRMCAIAHEPK